MNQYYAKGKSLFLFLWIGVLEYRTVNLAALGFCSKFVEGVTAVLLDEVEAYEAEVGLVVGELDAIDLAATYLKF